MNKIFANFLQFFSAFFSIISFLNIFEILFDEYEIISYVCSSFAKEKVEMLLKLALGVLKFHQEKFIGMSSLFEMLSRGQYPETLFITCSDSRLVPSLFTGSDPGDMFVVRNVGNIVPPYSESSDSTASPSEAVAIEYALEVLQVKNIILCGHSKCGAMDSLNRPNLKERLPSTASWLRHSAEVLKKIQNPENPELEDLIKQNILTQIDHLKTYPSVQSKIKSGDLSIHGWFYKFELGEILVYQESQRDFIKMELALKYTIEERIKTIVNEVADRSVQTHTWDNLGSLILEKLWAELGELFASPLDKAYQELIESAKQRLSDRLREPQSLFPYQGRLFASPLSNSRSEENSEKLRARL